MNSGKKKIVLEMEQKEKRESWIYVSESPRILGKKRVFLRQ